MKRSSPGLLALVTIVLLAGTLCGQELATEDPFGIGANDKIRVGRVPESIVSGWQITLNKFSDVFPSKKFDPLAIEASLDALKPETKYGLCFETGVLVRFDFFKAKASFFQVLLLPAKGALRDAKLQIVDEKFILRELRVDPTRLRDLLKGSELRVTLPPPTLEMVRKRNADPEVGKEMESSADAK